MYYAKDCNLILIDDFVQNSIAEVVYLPVFVILNFRYHFSKMWEFF
jgi:hypothetical protein